MGPAAYLITMVELTPDKIAEIRRLYWEEGCVHVPGMIDANWCDRLEAAFDKVIEASKQPGFDPTTPLRGFVNELQIFDTGGNLRVLNMHHHAPLFDEFVLQHPSVGLLGQVLGAQRLHIYADGAFAKSVPGEGSPTPWHNDSCTYPWWGYETGTLWVALSDVGPEEAPLLTVAGSNRGDGRYRSTFYPADAVIPPYYRPWEELMAQAQDPGADIREWHVKRGDILLIDPRTIHASRPFTENAHGRRLALSIRFLGETMIYRPDSATDSLGRKLGEHPSIHFGCTPPEDLYPVVWRA